MKNLVSKVVDYPKNLEILNKDNIESISLSNGLKVVFNKINLINMVSVYLQVNVGSNYEGDYLGYGISHFVEHGVFLGSSKFPQKDQISNLLESYGATDFNAFTCASITAYHFSVFSEYLLPSLTALQNFIYNPLFHKEEVENEKGTILSEMNVYEDRPDEWLYQVSSSRLHANQPNALPVIGLKHCFKKITSDDLKKYHQQHYLPKNMTLLLVGNFDLDSTKDFIQTQFNNKQLDSNEKQSSLANKSYFNGYFKTEPWEENQEIVETYHPRSKFIKVSMHWKTCQLQHEDNHTLLVLAYVLASNRGSILYEIVKEKLNLVEKISAYSSDSKEQGIFTINFTLKEELKELSDNYSIYQKIEEVKKTIDEIIQDLPTHLNQDLLDGAKNVFLKKLIDEKSSFMETAYQLAYSLNSFGHLNIEDESFEYIKKLKIQDIEKVKKKYLLTKKQKTIILLPEKIYQQGNVYPQNDYQCKRINFKDKKNFELELENQIKNYKWYPDKPLTHQVLHIKKDSKKITDFPTQKQKIKNQFCLLSKKITRLPKINLLLMFNGGVFNEKIARPLKQSTYLNGSFNLLSQLLFCSNQKYSKKEISKILKHEGIGYSSFSGENTIGINFSLIKNKLPKLLPLLKEILENQSFTNKDFNHEKKDIIFMIKKNQESSFNLALQNFKKRILFNTPYSLDSLGEEESLNNIDLNEIVEIKNNFLTSNNLVTYMIGDFQEDDLEKLKHLLNVSLAKSPSKNNLQNLVLPKLPKLQYQENSLIIEKEKGGEQTHFIMGYRAPKLDDKDCLVFHLINRYLSGIGGSLFKLRSENFIKEGKSLGGRSYRLGSYLKTSKDYGLLVFYVSFREEAINEYPWALESFKKEILALKTNLLPNSELQRAKNSWLADDLMDSIQYNQIAFSESLFELYGYGYDFLKNKIEIFKSIEAEDIRSVANKYFSEDNFMPYVMMPE